MRPPTAEEIAVGLGQTEGNVKRACVALEAHGLLLISQAAIEHINPSYTITPEGTAAVREAEAEARERIVTLLVRATARVIKAELGVGFRLAGGELRQDHATTEDLSVFVRVTGDVEGSVFFGLARGVARKLLAIVFKQPVAGIDGNGIRVLNTVAGHVARQARADFAAAGYSVDISPASTVHPAGTRITTLGVPQVVARLDSDRGAIFVHASLREVPGSSAKAA